eukprot:38553-Amphidinium_carterae.1
MASGEYCHQTNAPWAVEELITTTNIASQKWSLWLPDLGEVRTNLEVTESRNMKLDIHVGQRSKTTNLSFLRNKVALGVALFRAI